MAFEPLHVVIEDDDNTATTDPETGAVEIPTDDGGVIVQFNPQDEQKGNNDNWFNDLSDQIDPMELARIANDLLEAIDADDRSRRGHLDVIARGLSILGLRLEEPKSTVGDSQSAAEGMSSITNPLLLEAVLKGWANSRAELLPAEGPVKIAVEGEETAEQDSIAEALERDMNFYLTVTASEYVPEMSHMLLWGTHFKGAGFKKIYRCPMRRRPVSECVDTKDFIVSDTAKDLRSCGRITLQIQMRPSVMKRMQHLGAYRKIDLPQPVATTNTVDQKVAGIQGVQVRNDRPEDMPYNLYETQCELDLDEFTPKEFRGKGIPLPYFVTIDKDSREILCIRRDWNEDDDDSERRQLYVKFPYIPGPGFYGTGLLNVLGNLSAAMTAVDRESLDAGMYASFPGGLIASHAARQNTVNFRVAPGEFAKVDVPATMKLTDAVSPMPYKDVSGGLMTLREAIIAQAKGLAGAAEITVGEGVKDIPVGSMLAQIEQATKVMAACHKDLHQAHADEIECLIELFREHPEDFFRGVKKRKKFDKRNKAILMAQGVPSADIPDAPVIEWDEQKFFKALDDYQLIPRSDPNTPSHLHRLAKAVAYSQIVLNPVLGPWFDPETVAKDICRALKDDPNGRVRPPPQQQGPDPQTMKAMLDYQAKQQATQAKLVDTQQKGKLQADKQAGEQQIEQVRLQREEVIHQGDLRKGEQEHQANMAKIQGELQQSREEHQMEMQSHQMKHQAEAASHQLDIQSQQHQVQMDAQAAQQKNEMAGHAHEQQMRHTDEAHSQQMKLAEKQAQSEAKNEPKKPATEK